jgi:hypothetical protein
VLLAEDRERYDPDSPVFQVRVHTPPGAAPKLAWRATDEGPEEILSPSLVAYRVYCAALPDWDPETKPEFATAVAGSFSVAPGGKTLEEIALEAGLWEAPGSG